MTLLVCRTLFDAYRNIQKFATGINIAEAWGERTSFGSLSVLIDGRNFGSVKFRSVCGIWRRSKRLPTLGYCPDGLSLNANVTTRCKHQRTCTSLALTAGTRYGIAGRIPTLHGYGAVERPFGHKGCSRFRNCLPNHLI